MLPTSGHAFADRDDRMTKRAEVEERDGMKEQCN